MSAIILEKLHIKGILKPRKHDCNKGDFGRLLSITSCKNYTGAGIIAAKSALRCGVGICTAASCDSALVPLRASLPEAITLPLDETDGGAISLRNLPVLLSEAKKYSAVLLGCGLSVCKDTESLVFSLLEWLEKPTLLDADGINIAAQDIDILKRCKAPLVLTPHIKEMSRLCGLPTSEIKQTAEKVASEFAKEYGVALVLKDFQTVIATPEGKLYKNLGGHPCMAKGGSGDMLAGMIAAFLAQGYSYENAACMGVYMHARAGEICGERMGDHSVLASDMIEVLPEVFCSF